MMRTIFLLLSFLSLTAAFHLIKHPLIRDLSFKKISDMALHMSEEIDPELGSSSSAFTQKQLLKEETEAPFRSIRIYGYISLLAAAGLGAFICFTKILAVSLSGRPGDLTDLYTNLAINLGGVPIIAYLWKRDLDSKQSILERIQKGGSLAGLKVRLTEFGEPTVVKLSDLRRDRGIDKRVVIVAAPKELLRSSLNSSISQSKELVQNDLLVVPLVVNRAAPGQPDYELTASSMAAVLGLQSLEETEALPTDHIGLPVVLSAWNDVIKKEMAVAIKQNPDALDKGITIVIKKNGKVGTRRFGVPIWETLVEDVQNRSSQGLDISNI